MSSVYTFINDTINPGGGETNNIPTVPGLLSPPDEAAGIDPASVTFSWNPSTDADGDTISYQFYLSQDSSFTGCTPVDVAARSSVSVNIAGFSFSGIFLCLLLAGIRGSIRRIPVISLVLLLCVFAACSNSGNPAPPVNPGGMNHTETGLNPSTTYYWKVTADDGRGGISSSEIRSFTTTSGL